MELINQEKIDCAEKGNILEDLINLYISIYEFETSKLGEIIAMQKKIYYKEKEKLENEKTE
jgi:hypothetical protein